MKVFIVFLGLFIINVSFLSYQGDMGRYIQSQVFLKAVAEECAAGAAIYYDEAAYSDGQFQFNYEEGKKYIQYIIEVSKKKMPLPEVSDFSYEVSYQDDNLGYDDSSGENLPTVTVEITVSTKDMFRLPFIEVTQIVRAARYELPQ